MARIVLLFPLLLAACGGFETATTLTFFVDLDRAETAESRSGLLGHTVEVVRARLDRANLPPFRVKEIGLDRFVIELPEMDPDTLQEIIDLVTVAGRLEFRIEVLPRERYRDWSGATPLRLAKPETSPWSGTAEAFEAFKAAEVARWQAARDAGQPYEPSDERYRIVRRHETEGTDADDYHVLERLIGKEYDFDNSLLTDPVLATQPETGEPVVLYNVRFELRQVFHEWTSENRGLPLAIVLNDEYRSAPVIHSALRDKVQITLGRGSHAQLMGEAEALVQVLKAGALKVPPKFESVVHHVAKNGD